MSYSESPGGKSRPVHAAISPSIDDPTLRCALVRAQEMARYVESGTLDAGITGKDWIMENNSDVEPIIDLVYSKASFQPTRWVLAIPQDSPIQELNDLNGKKNCD